MATKRLERTVIEGGRSHFNTYTRRRSHRAVRAAERVAFGNPREAVEEWERSAAPVRRHVGKRFWDKLAVAERWLAKQRGRRWDDVRSEIARRFDTRTIAGQHIVFDHLLPYEGSQLTTGWTVHRGVRRFHVDDRGVLRVTHAARRRRGSGTRVRCATRRWIGQRRIGVRGRHVYWLTPASRPFACGPTRYRQGPPLTGRDRERYAQLEAAERDAFVRELEPAS